MKVTVRDYKINPFVDPVEVVINRYKSLGFTRQKAYSQYIQDTGLKPKIGAKKFFELFNQSPGDWSPKTINLDITPTHYDNLKKCPVEITKLDTGVFRLIWANGQTGSNPPCSPPSPDRFVSIARNRKDV